MKNFIIALLIIGLITGFVTIDTVRIGEICDEITELVRSEKFEDAAAVWDQSRDFLGSVVRDSEIDGADLKIRELLNEVREGGEYVKEKIVDLIDAIVEIKNSGELSLNGIF